MESRKKSIICTVLISVIMLIGAYVYAHIDKMQMLYDESLDTSTYIATGNVGLGIVEQTFLCKEKSLDGMNVKCQLFGDVTNVILKYQLFEEETDVAVAKGELAAAEIKNGQFNKLVFGEKVINTKGKKYTFQMQGVNVSEQQGVGFCYENKVEEGAKLSVAEEEIRGTLIAKTVTKRFDMETFVVVVSFIVFIWAFFKVLYKLFK